MGNSACAPYRSRTALVRLHAYDFSSDLAAPSAGSAPGSPVGTAAYQLCVEVYEGEWSYRPTNSGSGVLRRAPGECEQYSHCQAERLGRTELSHYEVDCVLEELTSTWPGSAYSARSRNSYHFCEELCRRLGVGPLPDWAAGFAFKNVTVNEHLQKVALDMREAANSVANRTCQIDLAPQLRNSAQSIKATAEQVDARLGLTAAAATAAAGAQGLARQAAELDARLRLSEAAAGAAAKAQGLAEQAASNARGTIGKGKESRGGSDSDTYQFGDFTRGLLNGAWGGAGAGPQGNSAASADAPGAVAGR